MSELVALQQFFFSLLLSSASLYSFVALDLNSLSYAHFPPFYGRFLYRAHERLQVDVRRAHTTIAIVSVCEIVRWKRAQIQMLACAQRKIGKIEWRWLVCGVHNCSTKTKYLRIRGRLKSHRDRVCTSFDMMLTYMKDRGAHITRIRNRRLSQSKHKSQFIRRGDSIKLSLAW